MLVFVQSSVSPNEMSFPGKPRASRKIYAQLTVRHSGSGKGKRSILSVVLVKRVARKQIPSSSRSPIPPFAPPILPFLHHTAFVRAVTQPTVFTLVGSMLVRPQGRTFEPPSCAKRPVPSASSPARRYSLTHVLGNTFTSDPPLPSLESVRCGPSYWTVPDPLFLSETWSWPPQ